MRPVVQWAVNSPVVANLLMIFLLVVGAFCALNMRREMFPEFSLDTIQVSVVYKGASVEEIEESINSRIEDAIQGIQGIKEITSTAVEGRGIVTVELETGTDVSRALNDVKNMVDSIDTFPEESERPLTVELVRKIPVIKVAVYGNVSEQVLTAMAERVETELLAEPGITQVSLFGSREHEIIIEIPESNLRKYGLTLSQVADLVKRNSIDLPAGTLRSEEGQVLLRTKGRRYRAKEFEDLVVVSRLEGTVITLADIATIKDSFEELDLQARMDGMPAILVSVAKTTSQDAIEIADKVKAYVASKQQAVPDAINITIWDDKSELIMSRLDLMIRNGQQGLLLVLVILALFLRLRLAFWVALGIPISITGSFVFLYGYDFTLNMISMYSFIMVLGIVVDDAIVVGENVYTKMNEGEDLATAAVNGTTEIAAPVVNAVATTIVAFGPMLFVAGTMGKFMGVFPVAIIAVLVVSLFEVFIILPAHLAHMKREEDMSRWWNPFAFMERVRGKVQQGLDRFIHTQFVPFMQLVMAHRYIFTALTVAMLILAAGLVAGGRVKFVFFPTVNSDQMAAKLVLPEGTSFDKTRRLVGKIEQAALDLNRQYIDEHGKPILIHTFGIVGQQVTRGASRDAGSHIADVVVELTESEERDVTSTELATRWRAMVGNIPEAISFTFLSSAGGHRVGGKPIDIALLGEDMADLRTASAMLKDALGKYQGVEDVEDSYRPGKQELRFTLKPGARQLGITLADLARQIRANFWGEEALKIQRGKNEVTIRVRYPSDERETRGDVERMRVRAPDNGEIPFSQVAEVEEYRGPSNIHRMYGRRSIRVSADVDEEVANAREVVEGLKKSTLPEVRSRFPNISVLMEGQEKERVESIQSLFQGLGVALFLIFVLLVNMFRTYTHPLIIMAAIPFSFIGIIIGHLLFGMDFTILSMFGILALAGIVVNDSLLLIEASNRFQKKGLELQSALVQGARNRFRQIILTTLSTSAGLTPLLLETSFQAQFLKPMTITVVFGLLAATVLILLLVPALTMIRADILNLLGWDPGPETESK